MVTALRATDGDRGVCGVARNGPRVLCALRGSSSALQLQYVEVADSDVLCHVKDRWSGRVSCRLADGREITLRRMK